MRATPPGHEKQHSPTSEQWIARTPTRATPTVPNLIPNNFDIMLEFLNERFDSVAISIQNGFARGTIDDDGVAVAADSSSAEHQLPSRDAANCFLG